MVGSQLQTAEGGLERGGVPPAPRPRRGVGRGGLDRGGIRLHSEGDPLPSGDAEMWRAAKGLGGETLGETEVALRPVRPQKSRTLVSCCGPEHAFGLFTPGEDLGIQA